MKQFLRHLLVRFIEIYGDANISKSLYESIALRGLHAKDVVFFLEQILFECVNRYFSLDLLIPKHAGKKSQTIYASLEFRSADLAIAVHNFLLQEHTLYV